MKRMNMFFSFVRTLSLVVVLLCIGTSCKKVEDAIFNFEGVFLSNDGWEVTLDESTGSGTFTKVGTARGTLTNPKIGDKLISLTVREGGNSNYWKAVSVLDENFQVATGSTMFSSGKVLIEKTKLTIIPDHGKPYSFTRTSSISGQPAGPTTVDGNSTSYGPWYFVKSDNALQIRYAVIDATTSIYKIRVQLRINKTDPIFCSSSTCIGYYCWLGFYTKAGATGYDSETTLDFYNSYTGPGGDGIYTLPSPVFYEAKTFSDGSKRIWNYSLGLPEAEDANGNKFQIYLHDGCVDIHSTVSPNKCASKSNSWQKLQ
jgi:hypothetical protein